jgi:hypothetical protein
MGGRVGAVVVLKVCHPASRADTELSFKPKMDIVLRVDLILSVVPLLSVSSLSLSLLLAEETNVCGQGTVG